MVDRQDSEGQGHIVWLDLEMTGLNAISPDSDAILDEIVEIGVIVTDGNLKPVNEGINLVVKPSEKALHNMNSFVTEMHRTSGLLEKIRDGISVTEAEKQVMEYLKKSVPGGRQSAPMGGNTISMDRRFLAKYMPTVEDYVHYRNIDVSALKELLRRWFPYVTDPKVFEKKGGHRALADAVDSIRELAYYRALLLKVPRIGDAKVKKSAQEAMELFPGLGK